MLKTPHLALVLGTLLLAPGCFRPEPMTDEQLNQGYVVMLPGVESGAWQFANTVQGMREAGMNRAIEIIEWGKRPFGDLINLMDLPQNRKTAATIAGKIVAYEAAHPGKPVTVIGYSGGGGMAAFVIEALPEGTNVEDAILIAAALSPQYDLTRVMTHCRRGVTNYYSGNDWWALGIGTSVLGTMDRQTAQSAGHVGFSTKEGKLIRMEKLTQVA